MLKKKGAKGALMEAHQKIHKSGNVSPQGQPPSAAVLPGVAEPWDHLRGAECSCVFAHHLDFWMSSERLRGWWQYAITTACSRDVTIASIKLNI